MRAFSPWMVVLVFGLGATAADRAGVPLNGNHAMVLAVALLGVMLWNTLVEKVTRNRCRARIGITKACDIPTEPGKRCDQHVGLRRKAVI